MRVVKYTDILKKEAPISAFQDPARIAYKAVYKGQREDIGMPLIPLADALKSKLGSEPYEGHVGIDFAVPTGTPVYAHKPGKVWIGPADGTQGIYLNLMVDGTTSVTLAHLSSIVVKSGATVKKGTLLAYTGSTGYVQDLKTGKKSPIAAHLHVHVTIDKQIADAYPEVFGLEIEPEVGKDGYKNWDNTDEWEKTIPSKAYQVDTKGESLRIRRSPGTDKQIVGALTDKTVFSIDKIATLPDGQVWGRLQGQPWHWVCIQRGTVFATEMKEWASKITGGFYVVRKSAKDYASQLGAFRVLENARRLARSKTGYKVFDPYGNEVPL